jgi:predicted permease
MTFIRALLSGLRRLLWRSRAERDLNDELQHYLELAERDHARAGLSPDAAARAARVEMGSLDAAREQVRGSRWEGIAGALWRDVVYAARMLRRSPGFTTVAVLVLALGIGVNTAVFSIINAVLFRTLPVKAPEELAFIYAPDLRVGMLGPYERVVELGNNTDLFAGTTILRGDSAFHRRGIDVERLNGESVTTNYFDVLGVKPRLGRGLVPALDDAPEADFVVVISDSLWRRVFNEDPAVIGQRLSLGGVLSSESSRSYVVVGVMGPEFRGVSNPWTPTEYWVPLLRRTEDLWGDSEFRGKRSVRTEPVATAIARMRPGVTLEQVQAFASLWAQRRASADSVWGADSFGRYGVVVSSSPRALLPFDAAGATPSRLGAGLLVVTSLVLIIGVANLAGLLMARGVVRRSEVAIRLTLGAGRWRVARQLVTEGLLIAALGAVAGLVLSRWLITTLLDRMPNRFARGYSQQIALGVPLDLSVLLFTVLVALVVGLVIGIAPVRQANAPNLTEALSGASYGASRRGRSRLRHWIVIPQVALSLALLLVAGIAVRTLLKVALVAPGYEPERSAFVEVESHLERAVKAEDEGAYLAGRAAVWRRMLEIAETSPGLEAAAIADALPTRPGSGGVISREDYESGNVSTTAQLARITPGYFQVLGIPFLRGRNLDSRDTAASPRVTIVDEQLASRLWPGQSAIGRYLATYTTPSPGSTRQQLPVWREVVGVVGAVRGPLSEGWPYSFAYAPATQDDQMPYAYVHGEALIARGRGSDAELIRALRGAVAQADPDLGIIQSRMLSDVVNERRYPRRVAAALLVFSGFAGLLLAGVGLYGVASYSVAQRLKELGIRAALGADRADIARLVVKEGLSVAAVGSVFGLILAYAGIRVTAHLVLPIPSVDASAWIAGPVVLGIVVLTACYIPARRAARVDPMVVLRAQ